MAKGLVAEAAELYNCKSAMILSGEAAQCYAQGIRQKMRGANISNETIDPAWAWAPWQAEVNEPWNTARAAHLLRRAAWGASPAGLQEAADAGLERVLDRLFDVQANPPAFRQASDQLAQASLSAGDSKGLAVWWLREMLETQTPLREKMTVFWHGHFATGADKVKEPQVMLAQNRLLREHALGDVAQLVHGISQDAAMLIYLDSAVNRKAHPNENFARELMELFCLGEGHYTERDVQELARCFTGWKCAAINSALTVFSTTRVRRPCLGRRSVQARKP